MNELIKAISDAIDAITNQIDGDMENYPELSKVNDELYYQWKKLVSAKKNS